MFCFSGRRRHTRWPRDWSSDVCSSDLRRDRGTITMAGEPVELRSPAEGYERGIAAVFQDPALIPDLTVRHNLRSEERRVGKESKCRWWSENKENEEIGSGHGHEIEVYK